MRRRSTVSNHKVECDSVSEERSRNNAREHERRSVRKLYRVCAVARAVEDNTMSCGKNKTYREQQTNDINIGPTAKYSQEPGRSAMLTENLDIKIGPTAKNSQEPGKSAMLSKNLDIKIGPTARTLGSPQMHLDA